MIAFCARKAREASVGQSELAENVQGGMLLGPPDPPHSYAGRSHVIRSLDANSPRRVTRASYRGHEIFARDLHPAKLDEVSICCKPVAS